MQEGNSREMDTLWGEDVIALRAENAERGQLFNDGNYAMFIHWGPYAQLANRVDGKTYYGIGEWIMNPRMANIPVEEYMEMAKTFNPVNFDATEIAQLACLWHTLSTRSQNRNRICIPPRWRSIYTCHF